MATTSAGREPDLRTIIARRHFVDEARVAVAGGAEQLTLMLALAHRADPRPVVVTSHTFSSGAHGLRAAGIALIERPLVNYRVVADDLCRQLNRGAGLAFVGNPHDPTGSVLSSDCVRLLCAAARANDSLVVFDESRAELALGPDFTSALWWARYGSHVCLIRTVGHVGYLIGEPSVVAGVDKLRDAFSARLDPAEQRAARAALTDHGAADQTRRANHVARLTLCRGLAELGVAFLPSSADFVLVHLPGKATRVVAGLSAANRARVRDTAEVGLADHLRVSVGEPEAMTAFVADLGRVLRPRTATDAA